MLFGSEGLGTGFRHCIVYRLLPHGFNLDVCRRLAEMKKKHKKANTDEHMDFPGREEIKFGEVVEAPPKLAVPKVHLDSCILYLYTLALT